MPAFPSPEQARALRSFGLARSDELPMFAAQWLAGDIDTPAVRELAGQDGSYGYLIDQLWAAAMSELDVQASDHRRSWELAMSYDVARWRAGELDTTAVIRRWSQFYSANDYPDWAPEAAHLYGLEDELDGGWGDPPDVLLADAALVLRKLQTT